MSLQKFEEQSRSKIKGYETDFDIEQGWGDLKTKLHQPKRSKKRFIFFLLIGLLGSLATFSWIQSTDDAGKNQISQIELPSAKQDNSIQTKNETSKIDDSVVEASSINTSASKTIKNKPITEDKNLDFEVTKKPSKISKVLENSSNINTQTIVARTADSKATFAEHSSIRNSQNNLNTKVNSIVLPLFPQKEQETNEITTANNTSKTNNLANIQSTIKSVTNIADLLPVLIQPVNASLNNLLDNRLHLASITPASIEVEKVIESKRNSLALLGGIYAFNNAFNLDPLQETEGIRSLNELEAFSIGLEGKFQLKKKVFLISGLEYAQYNERFFLNESNPLTREIEGVEYIVENQNTGVIEEIDGLLTQEGTFTYNVQHYNAYKQINLPLGLGLSLGSKKLNLDLSAGAIINLRSRKFGREWLNGIVSSEEAMIYNQDLGLSLFAQTDVIFKLGNRLNLQVSPHVRKSVSNWSTRVGVEQKPLAYGIRTGLNFAF